MNIIAIAFWILLGFAICEYTHIAFRRYFEWKYERERKQRHFKQTEEFRRGMVD